MRSKYNQSRTGGEVQLQGLNPADLSTEAEFRQDEFNRTDYEVRQINEKVGHVQRVVESLVTGEFQQVAKDFDPQAQIDSEKMRLADTDGSGIVSTRELEDYEMRKLQSTWMNRLNNIFNGLVGFLAGMALLEGSIFLGVNKKEQFTGSIDFLFNFTTGLQ